VIEPLTTSLDAKRLSPNAINSNLTVLSVEVHASSRGGLLPDPRHDRIDVICYAVEAQEGPTEHKTKARGVIMCKPDELAGGEDLGYCIEDGGSLLFSLVSDERELLTKLEELVRFWDPDFLAGFEVQKESIGYLVDRASQLNVRSTVRSWWVGSSELLTQLLLGESHSNTVTTAHDHG
jgi:DNA polymerase elongation subunit (family B)